MAGKGLLGISIVSLILCNSVFAIGLPKKLPGNDSGGISDVQKSKDAVVGDLLVSTKAFYSSLLCAGEAVGVKEEIVKIMADANALNEGNLEDDYLDKARKSSEEALALIEQKMQETEGMDEASKKLMVESVSHMVKGVVLEKDLLVMVKDLSVTAKDIAQKASALDKPKALSIANLAVSLSSYIPKDISFGTNTLKTYKAFMDTHNIEVPKDATDLLGDQ